MLSASLRTTVYLARASRTPLYPRRTQHQYSASVALYEYRCANGHSVEVFHRMDETPKVVCEHCGSEAERVLSKPMIHTQYYFSPQVHGANRPRHKPS